jgi:hypothetical protein
MEKGVGNRFINADERVRIIAAPKDSDGGANAGCLRHPPARGSGLCRSKRDSVPETCSASERLAEHTTYLFHAIKEARAVDALIRQMIATGTKSAVSK